MIELKLISLPIEHLKAHIHNAYREDDDLIEKYQVDITRTFDQCVDFNFEEIQKRKEEYGDKMQQFIVALQDEESSYHASIGYCVIAHPEDSNPMLFSFAIQKKWRTKEILQDWLKAIEEKLGPNYYTALWNQNTRAINFFKKNGFVAIPNEAYGYHIIEKQTKPEPAWQ